MGKKGVSVNAAVQYLAENRLVSRCLRHQRTMQQQNHAHLFFQEVSDSGALFLGNCGKDLVGSLKVSPHDSRLVLQDRDQERETDDVELLVAQVEAVVLGDVAQKIHHSVQ